MKDYYTPIELRQLIKQLRLKQEELAAAIGLTQGQVSRLIAGEFKKPGMAYRELCIFVSKALNTDSKRLVSESNPIMDAIAEVWDGSPEQANRLALVIRSLGVLCEKG